MSVRSLNSSQRRSIVRFDISSCNIPANALVLSGSLRLQMVAAPSSSRTYGAHRVTASWNENTVTYSNQPASNFTASASTTTGTTATQLSWSVLSDVDAFVKGTATNNGWLIRDSNEAAGSSIEGVFGTKENGTAANRPSLVITYYP